MGIEHPQMDMVAALFAGSPSTLAPFPPNQGLLAPGGKTPNQRALACAIGLAWARVGKLEVKDREPALAACRALFADMKLYGHQAVAQGGPGAEAGAPAPHDELWMGAMATMLREARLQGIPDLYASSVQYFADHVALARAFWTPAGMRVAGSRAKHFPGQPFLPAWPVDSWAYVLITGGSTAGLLKPTPLTLKILLDSAAAFPAILAAERPAGVKLRVAVRRWELAEGGFLAALTEEIPMNDRLAWVRVDAAGTVTGASATLADLPAEGAREPDLIFGAAAGAVVSPVVPSPPIPDPSPVPGPEPAPTSVERQALAHRVLALMVAQRFSAARATLAGRIVDCGPGGGLAIAAAWPDLGLNPGQRAEYAAIRAGVAAI